MFIAKFVDGPMNGREMELQKLELTVYVEMWINPGVASADEAVSYQKGIYIRKANPSQSRTPGSRTPYIYVWDGFHQGHADGWEETLKYNEAIRENARRLGGQ